MKTKLMLAFLIVFASSLFVACKKQNEPGQVSIQNPYPKPEEYLANLRAYKKTKHQLCFGWYAAYANAEGVNAPPKESASYGEHFLGLPDSMDIVSLWGGIPKESDSININYKEMRYVQQVKGTRMVCPVIVSVENHGFEKSDQGLRDYAKWLTDQVFDNDIDGLDLDWEPAGGAYLATQANFAKLVEYCSERVGPKSGTGKLLIIDYFNHTLPNTLEPFVDYVINQAYGGQIGSGGQVTATTYQNRYNAVRSWCPPEKFMLTENFGASWQTGGYPYTEANGSTISPIDGTRMYSLEGMARWHPNEGKKAGWGAFYFQWEYQLNPPYKWMRRCIQIANPARR